MQVKLYRGRIYSSRLFDAYKHTLTVVSVLWISRCALSVLSVGAFAQTRWIVQIVGTVMCASLQDHVNSAHTHGALSRQQPQVLIINQDQESIVFLPPPNVVAAVTALVLVQTAVFSAHHFSDHIRSRLIGEDKSAWVILHKPPMSEREQWLILHLP